MNAEEEGESKIKVEGGVTEEAELGEHRCYSCDKVLQVGTHVAGNLLDEGPDQGKHVYLCNECVISGKVKKEE